MALEDGGSYPPGFPGTGPAHHHRRAYVVPAVAVTVVGLVAIGIGEDIPTRHSIEHKLTDASEAALTRSGVPYESVSFTGRDGTVHVTDAGAATQARSVVADVTGVRVVHVVIEGSGGQSPPVTASPSPTVSLSVEPSPSAAPAAAASPSAVPSLLPSASPVPPTTTPPPSAVTSATPSAVTSAAPSASGGTGGGSAGPGGSGGASTASVQQQIDALGKITFASASAKLTSRDTVIVRKVAAILKANPDVRLRVQGDTDSSGPAAFNLTMSRRRAAAVAGALVALGIDGSRLTVVGYGETQPLVPNTSPANRAMNRRVDFSAY